MKFNILKHVSKKLLKFNYVVFYKIGRYTYKYTYLSRHIMYIHGDDHCLASFVLFDLYLIYTKMRGLMI